MIQIGSIHKKPYQCVKHSVCTGDVILTEDRKRHIINRRGQKFFERFFPRFQEIIEDPDYIFDNRKNTILVCKKFVSDGLYVNIVLRLAVVTDRSGYKNSIITVILEGERRFQQRLRNHVYLYKKE